MTALSSPALPTIFRPVSGSTLPESLIQAYLTTAYRVLPAETFEPFTLEAGREQPAAHSLMHRYGGTSAAFITAWNPFGTALTDEENAHRNQTLREDLSRRSLKFFEGTGEGAGGDWPGEESFFVIGLDLAAAKKLAIEFEQNALVWLGDDAIPHLVLLR